MSKKKPVVVTITKTKHKKQPYTVRIEQGKTDTILSQRYTRPGSARLGVVRKLGAHEGVHHGGRPSGIFITPDGREIKFVMK